MMCLTLTCTGEHAPDFGFLLFKHPDSIFVRELGFGRVIVFYPENTPTRATVAILVEVDTVGLVRGGGLTLEEYVNDRPYALSSLTSVALNTAFGTALSGRSKDRPHLVEKPLPLEACLSAVHSRGGPELAGKFFEPLGYEVEMISIAPALSISLGGPRSPIYSIRLRGEVTVHDLLSHLYVLIPVLDNAKHYFVAADEVRKLIEHGGTWLENHPAKNLITRRYLVYQQSLIRDALSQLTAETEADDLAAQQEEERIEEKAAPAGLSLYEQRLQAVLGALRATDPPAHRVLDLGCGEGKFLQLLLAEKQFMEIVGVDVSAVMLKRAERRLHPDRLPERQRARLRLLQGSLLYRDRRLEDFDAATLIEVIEHIPPERLDLLHRVLFESIRPRRLVITTPNREYNVHFEGMKEGRLRHRDHRFEWTRVELESWCREAAAFYGYAVKFSGIGPEMHLEGAPTQMAVFDLQ
jgi:3' terminal RNA ribose 2'-O-methyltransferase Hen1